MLVVDGYARRRVFTYREVREAFGLSPRASLSPYLYGRQRLKGKYTLRFATRQEIAAAAARKKH